jgi:diacylglycerol kinase (ATP)
VTDPDAAGTSRSGDADPGARGHKGPAGLGRLVWATRNSLAGLAAAWEHEAAFRQEVLLAAVLVPAGLWLGKDGMQRVLLVGSVLAVLVVELLNSAIEAVVDRISLDHHNLARRAKDLGSAAVFASLVFLAVVWLLVLLG